MKRIQALLLVLPLLIFSPRCFAEKSFLETAQVRNSAASFFDLSARRAELAAATNPRLLNALKESNGCLNAEQPAPPAGRMYIPHHYLSGSNGPVNPAEAGAAAPYRKLDDAVSWGASRYVATGDHAEAACVANLLARWAAAKALLNYTYSDSRQAWYQAEWSLGSVSLAYSVVQSDSSIPPEQRTAILAWMHQVTVYMFAQDPHEFPVKENNHAYWRAMAATSVGILTGDNTLYRMGLAQYARALAQMNSDGSLPLEMAREENSLGYQSYALAPLTMIAELASRQGVDLYSLRVNGHRIDDAVDFLLRASADPKIMKRYASEKQRFSLDPPRNLPGWMEFWARRHPGKTWDALLTRPLFDALLGGSATLYAAPAQAPPKASAMNLLPGEPVQ
jgi:poly(beta-D-mannuronate) lyase